MWKALIDRVRGEPIDAAIAILLFVGAGILGFVGILCFTIYKVAELITTGGGGS